MHRGDGHPRRGASSRRCNVVEYPKNRAPGEAAEAAEAEVDHLMKRRLGEVAVAVVEYRMNRTFVESAVVVEYRMKRAYVEVAEVGIEDPMKDASG